MSNNTIDPTATTPLNTAPQPVGEAAPEPQYAGNTWNWQNPQPSAAASAHNPKAATSDLSSKAIALIAGISLACGLLGGLGGGLAYEAIAGGSGSSSSQQQMQMPGGNSMGGQGQGSQNGQSMPGIPGGDSSQGTDGQSGSGSSSGTGSGTSGNSSSDQSSSQNEQSGINGQSGTIES